MLNDVGVKGTLAVDRVTGDRLCHSAPRTKDPAVYPMPLDASEPFRPQPAIQAAEFAARKLSFEPNLAHAIGIVRSPALFVAPRRSSAYSPDKVD
jgi:hypothetical protein